MKHQKDDPAQPFYSLKQLHISESRTSLRFVNSFLDPLFRPRERLVLQSDKLFLRMTTSSFLAPDIPAVFPYSYPPVLLPIRQTKVSAK